MVPLRDHNPPLRLPWLTLALILANVGVFATCWLALPDVAAQAAFYTRYGMVPHQFSVSDPAAWDSIVTGMFLHSGWLHLAGNMLFLWIFAENIEDSLGHFGMALLYLGAGVGAALWQVRADPGSAMPMVGASGAIAGVMGGYLLLFPRGRVDVLVWLITSLRIVPVPVWAILSMWFAIQLAGSVTSAPAAGGIAWWAHIGGFVSGLGLAVIPWLRRGGTGYWRAGGGYPAHPARPHLARRRRRRIPLLRR